MSRGKRPDATRLLRALAWMADARTHDRAEADPTGIGKRLMMQPSFDGDMPEAEIAWLGEFAGAYRIARAPDADPLVIVKDLQWDVDWLTLMYGIEQGWSDSLLAGVLLAKVPFDKAIHLDEDNGKSLETLGALHT